MTKSDDATIDGAPPLLTEKRTPRGIELFYRSMNYVRSNPQIHGESQGGEFSPMYKKPLGDALNLTSTQKAATELSSYTSVFGKNRVEFTSAEGKSVCAEYTERNPSYAFDYGVWSVLMNGCGK